MNKLIAHTVQSKWTGCSFDIEFYSPNCVVLGVNPLFRCVLVADTVPNAMGFYIIAWTIAGFCLDDTRLT